MRGLNKGLFIIFVYYKQIANSTEYDKEIELEWMIIKVNSQN